MTGVNTYNPKEIIVALGTHIAGGYAEDSFVVIDPNGGGITKKVGCDGEIARSIDPDDTFIFKLSLQQYSKTNSYLQQCYDRDRISGDGVFPIMVKDLKGGFVFSADTAWVAKPASRGYGKEAGNREWEIHTGSGTLSE